MDKIDDPNCPKHRVFTSHLYSILSRVEVIRISYYVANRIQNDCCQAKMSQ